MIKFLTRVVTSSVLIGSIIALLFLADETFFSLVTTIVIALALWEFFTLLKKANTPVYRIFGMGMGVSIPLVVMLEMGATQSGEVLFLVFGFLSLFLLQFFRKNNPQALIGISLTLFGLFYVSW